MWIEINKYRASPLRRGSFRLLPYQFFPVCISPSFPLGKVTSFIKKIKAAILGSAIRPFQISDSSHTVSSLATQPKNTAPR